MPFNSLAFLLFFIPVFVLYWKIPAKWQGWFLLLASYYAYLSWKPAYALLVLLVTAVSFLTARAMEKYRPRRKVVLTAGLLIVFGLLGFFKYWNFFSLTLSQVLAFANISLVLPQFKLLLPIGLSFYSFQTAGYLIDVYRGTVKAERSFSRLALFSAFFPLIGAGPIERSTHLLPQLKAKKKFDYVRTVSGLKLFAFGLFKKLVIADNLGLVVDRVFSTLPDYKGLSLILTMLFYTWQIYADFSGYTDMARGVGRMLGYDLLENFQTPYQATSIGDFWRRWHISLSSWFKDYVYIPLGGSRVTLLRNCLNLLIVFALTGLWHGAAWTFVAWGALHGLFICLERIGRQITGGKVSLPRPLAVLYTYGVVSVSWVFFRSGSFADAWYILRNSVIGLKNFVLPGYILATLSRLFQTNFLEVWLTLACLFGFVILDFLRGRGVLAKIANHPHLIVRWVAYTALTISILLLRNVHIAQFIYFQF